jgi:MFS family permease
MGKINFGRVLLGGLVAGLVINIGEFLLNGIVLHSQMEADFKRMNLTPPGNSFVVLAVGSTFIFGIVAVLLYAMIRSRLGPGPKTAIVTALILWFCICAYSGTINMILLSVPPNIMVMVIAWCLVEYIVGILAGAALYKET